MTPERSAEIARLEAEIAGLRDDVKLRNRYANGSLIAMVVQVVVADGVFIGYGYGVHWRIPTTAIEAWLAATVIQVVGVVLVITRSLFSLWPTERIGDAK